MANAKISEGDGIITFDTAADEIPFSAKRKMDISHIVLSSTTAGSFVIVLGNTTLTITTGTNDLSKVIPVNRTLNRIKLTSGPNGVKMYAFLKKK